MNLKEFADQVSRHADTEGTKLNRADVGRVISVALGMLAAMEWADVVGLLARAVKSGVAKSKGTTRSPKKTR